MGAATYLTATLQAQPSSLKKKARGLLLFLRPFLLRTHFSLHSAFFKSLCACSFPSECCALHVPALCGRCLTGNGTEKTGQNSLVFKRKAD
jgi:hypothetical protein